MAQLHCGAVVHQDVSQAFFRRKPRTSPIQSRGTENVSKGLNSGFANTYDELFVTNGFWEVTVESDAEVVSIISWLVHNAVE